MTEQVKVNFNKDGQYALWEQLNKDSLTSETFADFVKGAFHEKIDKIRASKLNLSHEEIERITFEQLKKLNVIKNHSV